MAIFSVWRLTIWEQEQCRRWSSFWDISLARASSLCLHSVYDITGGKDGRYISVVPRGQCYASPCLAGWHWAWHEPRVITSELLFWMRLTSRMLCFSNSIIRCARWWSHGSTESILHEICFMNVLEGRLLINLHKILSLENIKEMFNIFAAMWSL